MTTTAERIASLVLTDGRVDPEAGSFSRCGKAVLPMILGLVAPILLVLLIDPAAVKHGRFLTVAILIPSLLIAVAIYTYCVVHPGDVCGLVVDPAARTVTIVQANAFALRRTPLSFAEIAGARLVKGYDQDGYATQHAELVLRSGDRIPLAVTTTDDDVKLLQQALRST